MHGRFSPLTWFCKISEVSVKATQRKRSREFLAGVIVVKQYNRNLKKNFWCSNHVFIE